MKFAVEATRFRIHSLAFLILTTQLFSACGFLAGVRGNKLKLENEALRVFTLSSLDTPMAYISAVDPSTATDWTFECRVNEEEFRDCTDPSPIVRADGSAYPVGFAGNFQVQARDGRGRLVGDVTKPFRRGPMPKGADGLVSHVLPRPDGSLIFGGTFGGLFPEVVSGPVRVSNQGQLDRSFQLGQDLDSYPEAIALQPDGRLILAGGFTRFRNINIPKGIARITLQGSVDTAFINNQNNFDFIPEYTFLSSIRDMMILPDGRILIWGAFHVIQFGNLVSYGLLMLNADGSMDEDFHNNLGLLSIQNDGVRDVVRMSDGSLVLAARIFARYSMVLDRFILRISSAGVIDFTFNPPFRPDPSALTGHIRSISILSNDQIMVGAAFTINIPIPGFTPAAIYRLNTDGSIDNSLYAATPALAANGQVPVVRALPDGDVLFARESTTPLNGLLQGVFRISATGEVRVAFTNQLNGSFSNPLLPNRAQTLPGGRVLLGGVAILPSGHTLHSVMINNLGSIDQAFTNQFGIKFKVEEPDFEVLPNGDYLIGGVVRGLGNIRTPNSIAHVDANGNFLNDSPFNQNLGTGLGDPALLQKGANEKIYVSSAGSNTINSQNVGSLARLNADGSPDTVFNNNTLSLVGQIGSFIEEPNGKIVLIGVFNIGGITHTIARLNSDGSPDTAFIANAGLGFTGPGNIRLMKVARLPDARLMVVGRFEAYNGSPVFNIARLNSNGTLDTTFTVTFNLGALRELLVLSDGSFISRFATSTGTAEWRRYFTNGNQDLNFTNNLALVFGNSNSGLMGQDNNGNLIFYVNGPVFVGNQSITRALVRTNAQGIADANYTLAMPETLVADAYGISVLPSGELFIGLEDRDFIGSQRLNIKSNLMKFQPDGSRNLLFHSDYR